MIRWLRVAAAAALAMVLMFGLEPASAVGASGVQVASGSSRQAPLSLPGVVPSHERLAGPVLASTPVLPYVKGWPQALSWTWPAPGHCYGSGFGWREDPINHTWAFHQGLDIRAGTGTKVLAIGAGRVIWAKNRGDGYGISVGIYHRNGIWSMVAHGSKVLVSAGQTVVKGQAIMLSGATGRVTGAHIHLNIEAGVSAAGYRYGRELDPGRFLRLNGVTTPRC